MQLLNECDYSTNNSNYPNSALVPYDFFYLSQQCRP